MIPNTILLVDDDSTTNLLNKFFAESLDESIDVVTAMNGQEALDFLEQNDMNAIGPCYIILDMKMPIMDGWEFLAEFNKRFRSEYKEQVTIFVLTGINSEQINQRAKEYPLIHDTIEKPLSEGKFRNLIVKNYTKKSN